MEDGDRYQSPTRKALVRLKPIFCQKGRLASATVAEVVGAPIARNRVTIAVTRALPMPCRWYAG